MVSGPDPGGTPAVSREAAQVLRFIAAGAANTLLSIIVYQLALFAAGYTLAYGIAYVTGIAFAGYAYARHVFRTRLSAARFAAFAAFFVASLIAGAWVNAGFVEWLGLHPRLAIFATVAVMLPVNYVGSKWCLRGFAPVHAG